MAKTSLQDAQDAADTRRSKAGTWGGAATTNLSIGLKIAYAGGEAPRVGQTTVSVALVTHESKNTACYVSQNGKAIDMPDALQGWQWVQVSDKASATGLHAEMSLIRYLFSLKLLKHGSEASDAQALDLVVVCLNANVCGDCSGWMNAHGIAHCPALSTPKTSHNWIHPRTGAAYQGPKNISYYAKHVGNDINFFGGMSSGSLGPKQPLA